MIKKIKKVVGYAVAWLAAMTTGVVYTIQTIDVDYPQPIFRFGLMEYALMCLFLLVVASLLIKES